MGRWAFCIQFWVFSSLALRPTQQPDKNTTDKTKNELLKRLIGVWQFKNDLATMVLHSKAINP
jgi:hypothetical protein